MNYQREYSRRIRLGVIGVGAHAYRNLLPLLSYLPIELQAVCNFSNEEAGRRTAAQYGCHYYKGAERMYESEKLDAVLLCASPQAHTTLACEALDRGVHVFTEKPPAMNSGELERVLMHRGDRVYVVGYKKAFMPATDKAVEFAQSEKYGRVKSILASYPVNLPPDPAGSLARGEFSDWLADSCHPISFLLAVGGRAKTVQATQGPLGNSVCILEFENGALGILHGATGPDLPVENYSVYGDNWDLQIRNTDTVILNRGIPFELGRTESFTVPGEEYGSIVWRPQNCKATLENKALFVQGMYAEMKHFCDCVLEGKPATRGTLEFAIQVCRVSEAAMRSCGQKIPVNP